MSASPVSAERRITDYVLSPSHIPAPEIPDISDEDLRAFVAAAWAMIDEEEGLEQEVLLRSPALLALSADIVPE